jgi:hypothetical protein
MLNADTCNWRPDSEWQNENGSYYQRAKSEKSLKFIRKVEPFPNKHICRMYEEKSVFNQILGVPTHCRPPQSKIWGSPVPQWMSLWLTITLTLSTIEAGMKEAVAERQAATVANQRRRRSVRRPSTLAAPKNGQRQLAAWPARRIKGSSVLYSNTASLSWLHNISFAVQYSTQ